MEVQLTTDQKAFVRRAVESGRLHSEEEAIKEALALWEDRERQRLKFWRPLIVPGHPLPGGMKAESSRRNRCGNWPLKSESEAAPA